MDGKYRIVRDGGDGQDIYILNKKGETRLFTYDEIITIVETNTIDKMQRFNYRVEEELDDGCVRVFPYIEKFEQHLSDMKEKSKLARQRQEAARIREKIEAGFCKRCGEHLIFNKRSGLCYSCINDRIKKPAGKTTSLGKDSRAGMVEWFRLDPFTRIERFNNSLRL